MAKIGVQAVSQEDGEHGQDAIFTLIAAIMHLLNVGFKSGEHRKVHAAFNLDDIVEECVRGAF